MTITQTLYLVHNIRPKVSLSLLLIIDRLLRYSKRFVNESAGKFVLSYLTLIVFAILILCHRYGQCHLGILLWESLIGGQHLDGHANSLLIWIED